MPSGKSLPGFWIGMTMGDFQIDGIRQDVTELLYLLFAMIRFVLKSFKVPDVEVVAARVSNELALTCKTDSTPKNLVILDVGPGWMS